MDMIKRYKDHTKRLNDFRGWSQKQRGYDPLQALVNFVADLCNAMQRLQNATRPVPKFKSGSNFIIKNGAFLDNGERIISANDLKSKIKMLQNINNGRREGL